MEDSRFRVTRRALLASALATAWGRGAHAFAQEGAFHPRLLAISGQKLDSARSSAPSRWAWELVRRTSAPARLVTQQIAADDRRLITEPFLLWAGEGDVAPLTLPEIRNLKQYINLGGIIFVDDNKPESGAFGAAARRELKRVIVDSPVVRLEQKHVIYKSYYLIDRPVGRVVGPAYMEAIIRGRNAQVIFSSHDLLGALARENDEAWALDVEGGVAHRQQAIRLAVNIAMYVLCSDYKNDQVHAEELMRRRGRRPQ